MQKMRLGSIIGCIALFLTFCGCGPSEQQVVESVDIITQKFVSLPTHDAMVRMGLENEGAADYNYENEDQTITQEINYSVDGEDLLIEGVCSFRGYYDSNSGRELTGEVSYSVEANITRSNDFYAQLNYDVSFDTGKVKRVELAFDSNRIMQGLIPEVYVNDKKWNPTDIAVLQQAFNKALGSVNL